MKSPLRHTSLTFRLSSLFAISAIVVLTGTGAFLYHFLKIELMHRDHEELTGKVELYRHQLGTIRLPAEISSNPRSFREVIIGHPHLRLRLLDAQGTTLLTTSDWQPPPALLSRAVAAERLPQDSDIMMTGTEQPYHTIAAWGELGGNRKHQVLIVLGLEADEAQKLLARYEDALLLTLLFSGIIAALIGFLIVRRGLRPLHVMTETASEISASQLQRRLDVSDSPDELKTLAAAFNSMLERLHDSFKRLSDFSSDLAHELRTPINNLMGQTQVALSRTRNATEYHAVLESNLEEYERLARMIRDMLFLAQADNQQKNLQTEALDLRSELDKIAEFYQLAADERGVRITNNTSGIIQADRILLQRAIGNLLSNALQHCDRNSEISLTSLPVANGLQLDISNRGPVIPEKQLERIFDRFYRIDAASAGREAGTGLGLAIVKSIMQLHGGKVMANNRTGQGTTFSLYFPAPSPASTT